jgi:predicted RNase H-like HicB family nuclease
MNITFETEQESDGRWIAEVPELPGVMAYGASQREAMGKAEALALRVLAERIEHGEATTVCRHASESWHPALSVSA